MEFKDRLVQLRKAKNMLQSDMAKKIGVARATYGAYEQGTRQPDFETLQRIANYFEVSTDFLLGNSVDNNQTVYGKNINLAELSEKQRIVLEWALNQDALSFHSEDEIYKILDRLSVVMEYERAKSGEDGNNKNQI